MKRGILHLLGLFCLFVGNSINGKNIKEQESLNQQEIVSSVNEGTLHINSYALNMLGALVLEEVENPDSKYKFSSEVLSFCMKAIENQKDFTVVELARVVPELAKYFNEVQEAIRAPRPDAPGNTDGAPVGTLLECNLQPVLQLLNRLINIVTQCCAILQLDFQYTWTILADIKQTITTDFNGTFTFLNEIYNTLTTCCATLEQDFEFTWTILADIKETITVDFNGTFTFLNEINDTLTTCCATLEQDFEFTWTILADIKETITIDFNGTFTFLNEINDTLTACCEAISVDFEGVFTSLNEINDTLTACCEAIQIDFQGVFTSIEAIDLDFNSVFTAISDVKDTLTACCEAIAIDFEGVFTAINDISVVCDFNGVYTSLTEINDTLTACCEAIQIDFQGVFTAINDISVVCDFSGVYTSLTEINDTLTACCDAIQVDFQGVFTAINDISVICDFSGIYTSLTEINDTLTACCDAIQVDFQGVFTSISDVKDTLTACCAAIAVDFEGVFTAINDISAICDFSGVYTSLTEINDTLTACCDAIQIDFQGVFTAISDLNDTLTNCCAVIQENFDGTFTVLDSLKTSSLTFACAATPITTPTVIDVAGYYCLANDLVGTVSIIASNVTLDLNNHTITVIGGTAVQISGAQNVLVTNGRLEDSFYGVAIDTSSKEIILSNLLIVHCIETAINVLSGCNSIRIFDTIIDTTNIGIQFADSTDVECIRITINNINDLGITGSVADGLFEDCQVIDSIIFFSSNTTYGFNLENGINNQLIRCTVKGLSVFVTALAGAESLVASQTSFVGFSIATDNTSLFACNVQGLVINTPALTSELFYIVADSVVLNDCFVNGVSGFGSFFAGFLVQTSSLVTMNNCLVQDLQLGSNTGFGFFFEQDSVSITANNCKALGCIADGFNLNDATVTQAALLNCESNGNAVNGFNLFGGTNNLVGNCTAFQNGDAGFRSVSTFQNIYGCFAANNVGGNFVNIPNAQSAATSTLARGNYFTP